VTIRLPTQVGVVYGRLTVIGDAPSRNGARFVLYRCSCGTEKALERNSVRRGRTQSCGCLSKGSRPLSDKQRAYHAAQARPMDERFWGYVDKSAGPDACWPWTAARQDFGYGKFFVKKVNRKAVFEGAHRMAWQLTRGDIPSGQCVRHGCDNPPCCNPSHLQLGTQADNADDMAQRNRGRGRGRWKLSNEAMEEVRRDLPPPAGVPDEAVDAILTADGSGHLDLLNSNLLEYGLQVVRTTT